MACQITYKDKEYSYDEWIQELRNGLFDQLVQIGRIRTNTLSKSSAPVTNQKPQSSRRGEVNEEDAYKEAIHQSMQQPLRLEFIPNKTLIETDKPVEFRAKQRQIQKKLDVLNKLVNCI